MSDQTSAETVCLASISIDVAGDFANSKELKLRKQIEEKIVSLGIGPCAGSGSGMGSMDIEFLVESEEKVKSVIEKGMSENFPDVKYTLDFMITEGKPEDFIEEKSGCGKGAAAAVLVISLIPMGIWQMYHWIF